MLGKLRLFFVTIISVICCSFLSADQDIVETFRVSLQNRDASGMSPYFDHTVDMTYNNTQSTYSKTQAQMILHDFYTRHHPKSFKVDYIGASPTGDARYVVGTAQTTTGIFKIYLYISLQGKRQVIREMKIFR
jgi:hypothetical protein